MCGLFGSVGCLEAPPSTDQLSEDVALPPPANLQVTVTSTTGMTLTWDAVVGVSKYIILKGPNPGTETTFTSWPATSTTFAYNHLSPNTQYCWEVGDLNATNEYSGPSNEVCASTATAPVEPAPTNVTATAISSSRITVTWTAVSGATGYYIDMAQAPGTPVYVASVLAPATSYTVSNLQPSTTYNFDVRAVGPAGTSQPSSPIAQATTFALGLELYYKFDENAGTSVTDTSGFNRTGTLSGGFSWSKDRPNVLNDNSDVSFNGTTGVLTTPNQSAFNFGSTFSLALWVKIGAAGTTHIAGMRNASCGTVGWELAQDSSSLYFSATGGRHNFGQVLAPGAWHHVAVTNTGGNETLYIDGVQVANGSFGVGNHAANPLQIGAVGGCTGGGVLVDEFQIYSRVLSAQEVANLGTLPPPPTNLTVTVNSSTSETLNWTASIGSPQKYLIYKGTMSGDEVFFTSSPPGATTFTYGHLQPSTQYSWQVAVANSNNLFSVKSNEAIATTNAGPAAPTGVTATTVSSSRIKVAWSPQANVAAFYVYKATSSSGPFTFAGSVNGTTTSLTVAGLTTMTTYYFYVIAVDSGLTQSPPSATVNATTL